MSKTTECGSALDLMTRTLSMIKARHGDLMADAPQTRDLISQMIDSGMHDEAAMVSFVELSGGKRYDPKTASFH